MISVPSAEEYRAYTKECLDWAKTAQTERERDSFLQMAKTLMEAALITGEPAYKLAQPQQDKNDSATM
jgi:hypothetical protein